MNIQLQWFKYLLKKTSHIVIGAYINETSHQPFAPEMKLCEMKKDYLIDSVKEESRSEEVEKNK